MHLTSDQVTRFSEADLVEFVRRKIPEGHHLDYKQELSGKNRTKQHSEFLKDTTAFANAVPEEEIDLEKMEM